MAAARSVPRESDDPQASTIDLAVHYLAPRSDRAVVPSTASSPETRAADRVRRSQPSPPRTGNADRRSVGVVRMGRVDVPRPAADRVAVPVDEATLLAPRRSRSAFTPDWGC